MPTMGNETQLDFLAVCQRCRNHFTIYFWGQVDHENKDLWHVRVEKSRDTQIHEGDPYCKCGGPLSIYGNQMHLRIRR